MPTPSWLIYATLPPQRRMREITLLRAIPYWAVYLPAEH